uniref:Uncharacterized protein n=1 Tax=Kalanchoe fedtschenkoi TaxID=63787 RepID=A0A7N0V2A3_KALFE
MRTIGVPVGVPLPTAAPERHSAWKSPLPYLFGGMGAMMLLIVTALIILLCSYWKRTSDSERAEREQWDLEAANHVGGEEGSKKAAYAEKFVVIMAGDEKPTFLATPRCYRGYPADEVKKQSMETEEAAAKEKSDDETTTSHAEQEGLGTNPAVD